MNTHCKHCSVQLPASRINRKALYCSDQCSRDASRARRGYQEENATCQFCGQEFSYTARKSIERKYCKSECRRNAHNVVYKKLNPDAGRLPSGTVGAIGELAVAVDLLQRGYEVFRSVSQSCSCDLAILYKGKLLRVEVRTAYITRSGGLTFAAIKSAEKFDLLALPYDDGRSIEYRPPLTELL